MLLLTYQPREPWTRIAEASKRWRKSPDIRDRMRAYQLKGALNGWYGRYPTVEQICKAFDI